jgi:hypothetical protein
LFELSFASSFYITSCSFLTGGFVSLFQQDFFAATETEAAAAKKLMGKKTFAPGFASFIIVAA